MLQFILDTNSVDSETIRMSCNARNPVGSCAKSAVLVSALSPASKAGVGIERDVIECWDARGRVLAEKVSVLGYRCARLMPCATAPTGYFVAEWFVCDQSWVDEHRAPSAQGEGSAVIPGMQYAS